MMAPCPEAEVTALAPQNLLESTWSVGSSATEIIINFDRFITKYHPHHLAIIGNLLGVSIFPVKMSNFRVAHTVNIHGGVRLRNYYKLP